MRKLTPLFATLAAILCLCFSAVACNKQNASKIAGTYKLSSMTMTVGGATVTLEAGKDFRVRKFRKIRSFSFSKRIRLMK